MPTPTYETVYSLAEDQMGYVTAAQAAAAGVRQPTLVMMARRGALQRVSRGVYRLVHFPGAPLAQYMQATLWPYDRAGRVEHRVRGVLSHETALALHELSDVAPPKVHITVPAAYRCVFRRCRSVVSLEGDYVVRSKPIRRFGRSRSPRSGLRRRVSRDE